MALARSRKRISTPTALANAFNLRWRGASITTQAAQKWLQGTAMPTPEKIEVLAEMLAVPLQWLRYGIGATRPPARHLGQAEEAHSQVDLATLTVDELRLVARLRGMTEQRRGLVRGLVAELALEQEMWVRGS
jgi:hypothetical protein